ncbi:ribbon-helix-helix domain-containing protein [Azospirillum sp.]|uniref:ribbon-helix-helix domain-containing protein n=1 Tax=Azospirillum sp. TaxID=34012 RepID=UPI002D4D15F9|nr:type II toxin-antitoxin system ParD family antitoxin [Azospirillum sp.]HYD67128.1 type II toxin-antitoxin system ParD family antitoxin [Azospirillum sp.]
MPISRRVSQSIPLTPDLDRSVQAQAASGRYQTVSEAIRDALRLLQERTPVQPRPKTAPTPEGGHGR